MTGAWPVVLLSAAVLTASIVARMGAPKRRVQRGRRLVSEREARRRGADGASKITWGGVALPPGAEAGHFVVVGTTGSGKSLTLARLMREALGAGCAATGCRALVYDAKADMLGDLAALALPVVTLNPFDRRCAQWDMAADVTSPATALQVAALLIPEETGSNRYFSDAARDLLTGAMLALVASGVAWTLRDVLLAMRSRESLHGLLARSTEGQELWELYSGEPRAFQNVLATARSRLAPMEPVAACWARATQKVSLRAWIEGDFVLVLGNDDAARAAVDTLNRVLFQRATELALAEANSTTRRTWFFLDEVREAGKLDGLVRLMNKGRSRGCCVALGFQDIHGLQTVYGREAAFEIIGQCSQKAFLRMESGETATWAAAQVGQFDEVELMQSDSRRGWLGPRAGRSMTEQRRTTDTVMPSEFLTLPPTSRATGLTGYYLTPHVGAFRRREELDAVLDGRKKATEPDLVERQESDQYLEAWTGSELEALGIHGAPEREAAVVEGRWEVEATAPLVRAVGRRQR